MTDKTLQDLRALAGRPSPSASLPAPWDEVRVADDPVRSAVLAVAERSANAFAVLSAAKAADMLRRALPGAAVAVFGASADGCGCGCDEHRMFLQLVRDRFGTVLWCREDLDSYPAAVSHAELEAYGGPVLPHMDTDTQQAIEMLAVWAQVRGGPLTPIDSVAEVRDGKSGDVDDADLWALDIKDTITFAATLPDTYGELP